MRCFLYQFRAYVKNKFEINIRVVSVRLNQRAASKNGRSRTTTVQQALFEEEDDELYGPRVAD